MPVGGKQGASASADRAGGPTDLSRCASQPKALIPCAIGKHVWVIGRFQADDESECRICLCQSDEPAADEPCCGHPPSQFHVPEWR